MRLTRSGVKIRSWSHVPNCRGFRKFETVGGSKVRETAEPTNHGTSRGSQRDGGGRDGAFGGFGNCSLEREICARRSSILLWKKLALSPKARSHCGDSIVEMFRLEDRETWLTCMCR